MPRLEELATLCKVIEQKSFSRAAEILGLSQPAVSLQIKSLEAEYGTELLHRDGFEIVPTESGQAIYNMSCQILELHERAKQQIHRLNHNISGTLLIGSSAGPGEYLLPLLLGQFKSRYPTVDVVLQVSDSSEIINQILKHQLEVGFVGTSRRDRHLHFEPFIQDELVLVVYPDHPWVGRRSISHEELLQEPLLLQQHGSGATISLYEALNEYNININQLNIFMELGLQESTKAAVRAGLGVTIISKLGVIEELARGVLVKIPIAGIKLERNFYVVHRRASPLTSLARAFLQFAHKTADQIINQIQNGFTASNTENTTGRGGKVV